MVWNRAKHHICNLPDFARLFWKDLLTTLKTSRINQQEAILLHSETVSCLVSLSKNWPRNTWFLANIMSLQYYYTMARNFLLLWKMFMKDRFFSFLTLAEVNFSNFLNYFFEKLYQSLPNKQQLKCYFGYTTIFAIK